MRLVLFRPEPGLSASLQRAAALGLEPVARPLFALAPVAWQAPDAALLAAVGGLVVTSANAIRHGGPGLDALRGLPVHAVGAATADAARAAGFTVASVGEHGIEALVAHLRGDAPLLHLCGRERREADDPRLHPLVVYEARPVDPAPSLAILEGAVGAVHSPRAGATLDALAAAQGIDRTSVRLAAISAAAAAACGAGWARIEVAERPQDSALLEVAARLCQNRVR